MKINYKLKQGFTLIELLAVIIILGVLMLIAIPAVTEYINNSRKNGFKESATAIARLLKSNYFSNLNSGEVTTDIEYYYNDGVESSSIENKTLEYKGKTPKDGIARVTINGDVAVALHDGTYCAVKSYVDKEVTVEKKPLSECNYDYSVSKSVNIPKLAKGMTPIKWNGTSWIDTVESDENWYSYDTTSKKWANARTQDGSMWVWIPRYIYKITSNWHVNTTGTIEIKFSKGIDDTISGTEIIDDRPEAAASNAVTGHELYNGGKYTNHPGFTFGTTELTGIWVAKFEATASEGVANGYTADLTCPIAGDNVATKTIQVLPNVASWRCQTIGNAFTAARNMEASSVYGWNTASTLKADGTYTTDTNNVDTHLMKNVEWGAVSYLSKSQYGKNTSEIWINNANDFTTGCAGNSASEDASVTGCINTYNTMNGVKASTTGTIYGVYDMSGGSWERVSAYVDNANWNLAAQGASIVNATSKYKDIYTKNTTDDPANNYALTTSRKGDAIWETSNNIYGSYSWFSDVSFNMPNTSWPLFVRGGDWTYGSRAGAFGFGGTNGGVIIDSGFRPVVLVNAGL